MAESYKVGDRVGWDSEAGRVSRTIIRIHTTDFDYRGNTQRANPESLHYEIKSSKTDHIAAHTAEGRPMKSQPLMSESPAVPVSVLSV